MDVAIVAQRIGTTVIQQQDLHRTVELEHVENWDSRHSLQPQILRLAFPHHLATQHDLAHQHGLAVHPEKKTLVHFACEMSSLTHRVRFDVNLIVRETVQSCHEIEQHGHEMKNRQDFQQDTVEFVILELEVLAQHLDLVMVGKR